MDHFELASEYRPTGDQPKAIEQLVEVDQNANNRMEILVSEMMKAENVTEEMKTTNQMKWLGMVNNIRHRAEEIILKEIIYS